MAQHLSSLSNSGGFATTSGPSDGAQQKGFMATRFARDFGKSPASDRRPPPPPTLVVKLDDKTDAVTESDKVIEVLSGLKIEAGDAVLKSATDAIVLQLKTSILREQVKDALIASGICGDRLIERNGQNPTIIVKNLRLDKQPEVVYTALLDQNRHLFASNQQDKDVKLLFPRIRRFGVRKNTMDLVIQVSPAIFKRIEMSDKRVKLGAYSVFPVDEWQVVDRCTRCSKIGHSRKRCKACPKCLSEKCKSQSEDDCPDAKKVVCFKCGQNHMSTDCNQTPKCEPCYRRLGGESARTEQYSHVLFSSGCATLAAELERKRRNTNYA